MLKMELDDLKAAWQREKEAYPWDEDPKAILAKTKKLAIKRDRKFKRQQWTQILCCLFCLGDMVTRYSKEGPLLANVGLILMNLSSAIMVGGTIILKYRLRESHPWLPDEEFLNEERKKIEARIALLRRNARWFFLPSVAGLLMWQVRLSRSFVTAVAFAVFIVLSAVGTFWFYRWKLRTDLLPLLEDIDRDLQHCRENADSWPE